MSSLFTQFTAFEVSGLRSTEVAEAEHYPKVTIYKREEGPPASTISSLEMFVTFNHGDFADPFSSEGDSHLTRNALAMISIEI